MLVKQIVMKKGTFKKTVIAFTNYLEQMEKFLASEYRMGQWIITACFDNEIDYFAFIFFAINAKQK